MKHNTNRRRRSKSCSKIAYDTTAATAAGMAGLCRTSGGVSDRRGRIRREWERGASECGRRPSGRTACGGSAATVVGRSRMWPTRLMTRYSRQAGQ